MKKLLIALLGTIITLAQPLSANAASYGVSLTGGGSFTDSVSVSLSVYGSTSAGGACGGICGVTADLSYDKTKVELMSATAQQGFDFTQGAHLVLYKSTAASNGSILTLRFRNLALADGESTDISIKNVVLSNGDTDLSVGNTNKSIKYTAPVQPTPTPTPTPVPSNNDDKKESGSDDQKKEDDSSDDKKDDGKDKEKSKNASLSTIEVSQGEIKFDKDILSYDVIVEESVSEINIAAKTEDKKATVAGGGKHSLGYGSNLIKIVVTAEDGSEKEYTINVFREVSPETMARHEKELEQAKLMSMIFMIISGLLFAVAVVFIILFFLSKKKKSKPEEQEVAPQPVQPPVVQVPMSQPPVNQASINQGPGNSQGNVPPTYQ